MRNLLFLYLFLLAIGATAQNDCKLTFYKWTVRPSFQEQSLEATAMLHLSCPSGPRALTLQLDPALVITTFEIDGYAADFSRNGEQLAFTVPGVIGASDYQLTVGYEGEPLKSRNPPWTGGWYWTLDQKDRSWLSVVAGEDNPLPWVPTLAGQLADSACIEVISTSRLTAVATGYPVEVEENKKQRLLTHRFFYPNPIKPTDFQLLLGHYERFDTILGGFIADTLAFSHYFKDYNYERGRKHFRQLENAYAAWQHFLGPVKFANSQLTFVQTPHSGMAKSGLTTYGNRFMRGNFGGFVPRDMGWDYELVRHTASQYVNHRLKYQIGSANRWIAPAWVTYLESLFVEFHHGTERANEYLSLYRPFLRGYQPLVDSLANNIDLYDGEFQAKGALLLHTLRLAVNDDQKWFSLIRDFFDTPAAEAGLTNAAFQTYLEKYTGLELTAFFEQYLHHRQLPHLAIKLQQGADGLSLAYRFTAEASNFNLPLDVIIGEEVVRIQPVTDQWQTILLDQALYNPQKAARPDFIRIADRNILVDLFSQ